MIALVWSKFYHRRQENNFVLLQGLQYFALCYSVRHAIFPLSVLHTDIFQLLSLSILSYDSRMPKRKIHPPRSIEPSFVAELRLIFHSSRPDKYLWIKYEPNALPM